jgi:hypothetical protein
MFLEVVGVQHDLVPDLGSANMHGFFLGLGEEFESCFVVEGV